MKNRTRAEQITPAAPAAAIVEPEQATGAPPAALAALVNEAAALDTAAAPPAAPGAPGEPAAPPPPDYQAEALDLVEFAVEALVPLYPSLAAVYTKEKQTKLAAAAGNLMAKYQVNLVDLLRWLPELQFAIIALPLATASYAAIRADIATMRAAEAATPTPAAGLPANS